MENIWVEWVRKLFIIYLIFNEFYESSFCSKQPSKYFYAVYCSFQQNVEQVLSDFPPLGFENIQQPGNGSKIMACCKSDKVSASVLRIKEIMINLLTHSAQL